MEWQEADVTGSGGFPCLLATTRLYSAMVFWYWHWYFLLEYQVVLVHLLACNYSPLCTEILLVLHWYLYRQCYWNIYWYWNIWRVPLLPTTCHSALVFWYW